MVGRLLEGREHQHAVLHLRDSETRDPENLPLFECEYAAESHER